MLKKESSITCISSHGFEKDLNTSQLALVEYHVLSPPFGGGGEVVRGSRKLTLVVPIGGRCIIIKL